MKDFVRDLRSGRMGRREANRRLAALGLGLVTLPYLGRAATAATNDILYYTWEDYGAPELHPKYIEKYGASPEYAIFATEEEALQKVRAGFQATLGHPCTYAIGRWYDAGILQPLDVSRLSNYGDVFPEFKAIEGTAFDGKPYYAPFDWGNSSIIYRTDLIDEPESWTMLFDEKYAGKIGMSSDPEACVEVAALALGYKNIFTLDDDQLAAVRELLIKQRRLLRFYWDSNAVMEQAMASGEIVVAYAWNQSKPALLAQGIPVEFANPKEGIFTWVCGLVMFKDAIGSQDAAYDFIDAMLDPEVGRYIIDTWNYGHSNQKAFELADPAVLASLGMQKPEELFTRGIFFQQVQEPYARKYAELFNEIQAM